MANPFSEYVCVCILLSNYSKFLVIWCPSIRNSHPTDKNFKDHFYIVIKKQICGAKCSPAVHSFPQLQLVVLHVVLPLAGTIIVEACLNLWSCHSVSIQNLSSIRLLFPRRTPHKRTRAKCVDLILCWISVRVLLMQLAHPVSQYIMDNGEFAVCIYNKMFIHQTLEGISGKICYNTVLILSLQLYIPHWALCLLLMHSKAVLFYIKCVMLLV
jgi:hypothetical protein